MRTNADVVERAIILTAAVMAALGHVTFDTVVRFFIEMAHNSILLFECTVSLPGVRRDIPVKISNNNEIGRAHV